VVAGWRPPATTSVLNAPKAGSRASPARSAFPLDDDRPAYQDQHIGFRIAGDG
jgi:hypothetical protein